jgi:hypothetical protein
MMNVMKMYFLVYHATPLPDLNNSANFGGAYISCWIEADTLRRAEKISRREIKQAKWKVLTREEAYETRAEYYIGNPSGLEYFQQALTDKWVLRIHTYPKNI